MEVRQQFLVGARSAPPEPAIRSWRPTVRKPPARQSEQRIASWPFHSSWSSHPRACARLVVATVVNGIQGPQEGVYHRLQVDLFGDDAEGFISHAAQHALVRQRGSDGVHKCGVVVGWYLPAI